MKEVRELEPMFMGTGEVGGFIFEQVEVSPKAFLYRVYSYENMHYEVFTRKVVQRMKDWAKKELHKDKYKVVYPKSSNFGVWAWCYSNHEKAVTKYNSIK